MTVSQPERLAPTFAAMPDAAALVLDDPSVASEEARMFAGFPGLWVAGVPVAVQDLGFENPDECYKLVRELGLPLKRVKPKAAPAAADEKKKADE